MLTNERLDQMISGMKMYADFPNGISKDLYSALVELKEQRVKTQTLETLLCNSRYVDVEGSVSCLGERYDCPEEICEECVHGNIVDVVNEILGHDRGLEKEEDHNTDLLAIANHFGEQQMYKLIEEMAELTRAIVRDDDENMYEEIADVEIVLEQLRLISHPDVRRRIERIKKEKISRTLRRIEEGKA